MNATCLIFHRENVTVGEKEQRMMMTGMHIVVDIFCVTCGSIVGWKYVSPNQLIFGCTLDTLLFSYIIEQVLPSDLLQDNFCL